MLPEDREIASYLFSEKINYLAHVNVGKRQRAVIIFLLGVSAVLSSIAGAVGLSDMSKSWVSGVTLVAGAVSVLVLALLPWANWKGHLRVGSDYEALYQDTLACRMGHGTVDEERWRPCGTGSGTLRMKPVKQKSNLAIGRLRDIRREPEVNSPRVSGRPIPSS